jgi:hypothetical protein
MYVILKQLHFAFAFAELSAHNATQDNPRIAVKSTNDATIPNLFITSTPAFLNYIVSSLIVLICYVLCEVNCNSEWNWVHSKEFCVNNCYFFVNNCELPVNDFVNLWWI